MIVFPLRLQKSLLDEARYAHADKLAKLHPNNTHVRDKIRQQLQVLRDLGFLQFFGSGSYRLR